MSSMDYSAIAEVYEKLGQTTKRLEMTDILVAFLKGCPPQLVEKIVYLTQGRIYPEFVPLELGIADRLIIRGIAKASGAKESEVDRLYKRVGDLGNVALELLLKGSRQVTLDQYQIKEKGAGVTVERVYSSLDLIAHAAGQGSQDEKLRILSDLLGEATPKEAMYIIRTVSGALRLGIADMTILDALAIAFGGSKDSRSDVERAYNVSSDLGAVAKALVEGGIKAVAQFQPRPGRPIKPMLAERLSSAEEILQKMGGSCAVEYKYDGERVQIHRAAGGTIALFSRRLESVTAHFPDIVKLAAEGVASDSYIVEGEIVAVNPETGDLLPFQQLMHRRRKYGIQEAMADYPASIRLFDLLVLDGKDYTGRPYPARRRALKKLIGESERLRLAEQRVIKDEAQLESFFEEAIAEGCEGLVAKSLSAGSTYKAGARGWLWIKYKREYRSELTDTVDLVTVGGFMGTGKRAGSIGTLLLAAYDEADDTFKTVCRCSTGFTDAEIAGMEAGFRKYMIPKKHGRVVSKIEADVWFVPARVLEVLGAEVTLSPIHTCGMDTVRKGAGLAIRFPRFTGKWRQDKAPEDATTSAEILQMYKGQLKKISE
jgi:DNA ligase-1